MVNEPGTLYKLMTLYMLSRVNFPLTNSQIADFFVSHEYTNIFNLQNILCELSDAKLISSESIHNLCRYTITAEGRDILSYFQKNIPLAVISDIDDFLKENKLRLRNESASKSFYYEDNNHDYNVHCEVMEGKSKLISLEFTVPDERQAKTMTDNWKEKSSEIYSFLIRTLMSDN